MRRPLLAVCICLVAVTALRLLFAGPPGQYAGWAQLEGREITVAGQLYQKTEKYYYIKDVQILEEVAGLQPKKSNYNNFIVERPVVSEELCESLHLTQEEALLGSVVVVRGTFYNLQEATNPGEFDGKIYYSSIGISGRMWDTELLGGTREYSELQEYLYQCREYFKSRLYHIFPEKEASIMCTILLGDTEELDADTKALYQRNGIVHILSISGLHISIIGMGLFKLLKKMGVPIWLAAICGGVILCLYGMMCGMGVSVCRAIGMYLIRMLGVCMGRTYDMMTAWGVVGLWMVLDNPLYLTHCGFLLSYGSVLGIGVCYPMLLELTEKYVVGRVEENLWKAKYLEQKRKLVNSVRQSMLAGLSVTLVTLPIQLWFFFEVPLFSILLNLVVVPFMSLLMVAGLVAMLIPGLGMVGTIDVWILKWYEIVCELCDALPISMWNPGRPAVWQMVVYYGMLLGFFAGLQMRKGQMCKLQGCNAPMGKPQMYKAKVETSKIVKWRQRERCAWSMGGLLTLAMLVAVLGIRSRDKHIVTFLDVGQGDCICLQTKDNHVYLFDCGSTSRKDVGTYVLKPFLKYSGISQIDGVFVSHSDADHNNGIEELLECGEEWGIEVKNVLVGNEMRAGMAWETESIRFVCIHPETGFCSEDTNEMSQCFYVEFDGGTSMLFTGDVEGVGEDEMLHKLKDLQIDGVTLLKVAHHGSKNSTSEQLLQQINPQVAVISCGSNNRYGHPHEELLERLAEAGSAVLTTPQYGAIIVEVGDDDMKVRGWK